VVVAWILIQTEVGRDEEVERALTEVRGVRSVHLLYGAYDFLVSVEAHSLDWLKAIVSNEIRKIKGIRAMVTMIEVGAWSR